VFALLFGASALLPACGGDEVVEDELAPAEDGAKADSLGGKFCGGIANLPCPQGYSCQLDGSYPDAGGKCAKQKKCGPFPGGGCATGQVCNIQSCGLGSSGVCVTQPQPDQCVDLPWLPAQPVCGCDGTTYPSDCQRLAAGAALDHEGPCNDPCWGSWIDQFGTCRTPSDGVYPDECCQPQMCGGIANLPCPEGQKCQLDGNHPDASGRCVPAAYCDVPKDCFDSDIIHPMCLGQWRCNNHLCGWHCGYVPQPKTCGPFPGGTCAAGETCNIQTVYPGP
jgi:hypothetical protein